MPLPAHLGDPVIALTDQARQIRNSYRVLSAGVWIATFLLTAPTAIASLIALDFLLGTDSLVLGLAPILLGVVFFSMRGLRPYLMLAAAHWRIGPFRRAYRLLASREIHHHANWIQGLLSRLPAESPARADGTPGLAHPARQLNRLLQARVLDSDTLMETVSFAHRLTARRPEKPLAGQRVSHGSL